MNDMPMVWVVPHERLSGTRSKKRSGFMLAVALLCAMAAAEVLFLNYVAGPDSVAMMMAAEGVATSD
jgi:hypothetical protein